MHQFGWLLRKLDYLDLAKTQVTDSGLMRLEHSETLKVLTVSLGTKRETILALLKIRTLQRVRMPLGSVIPEAYRSLAGKNYSVTDHLTIMRTGSLNPDSLQALFPGIWQQLRMV
jgi:hypothetical protein